MVPIALTSVTFSVAADHAVVPQPGGYAVLEFHGAIFHLERNLVHYNCKNGLI